MRISRRAFLTGLAAAGAAGCVQPPSTPPGAPSGSDLPPIEAIAYQRLAFGPRPEDLDRFRSRGPDARACLENLVEEQLHPEDLDDSECERRLRDLKTLKMPLERLWSRYYDELDEDDTPLQECLTATFLRAVYSRRQLSCVLVDFWHDHFHVCGDQDEVSPLFADYDRTMRSHALGNFRSMLGAVARHPAMLFYLDNGRNRAAGPNENYAGELLELHTLGAESYLGPRAQAALGHGSEGYCDNDVYEVARCFTGWRIDDYGDDEDADEPAPGFHNTGHFLFHRPWHDRFNKLVLGQYLPPDRGLEDGDKVLDILAAHPRTARFVCTKLCRRLVGDDPPWALVNRAAHLFHSTVEAPDQLRQVVRLILLSTEFASTFGEKLKRPFEFTCSLLRATGAELDTPLDEDFLEAYDLMGQPLFGRVTPDGYPDRREAWAGTASMLGRFRLARALLRGDFEGVSIPDPARVSLQEWSRRLLGRDWPRLESLQSVRSSSSRSLALLAMSPEFQLR